MGGYFEKALDWRDFAGLFGGGDPAAVKQRSAPRRLRKAFDSGPQDSKDTVELCGNDLMVNRCSGRQVHIDISDQHSGR